MGAVDTTLSQLIGRSSNPVREHEILRLALSVSADDPEAAMAEAQREALIWAQRRSGGSLPDNAWQGKDFELLAGGRTTIGVNVEIDNARMWALRSDDPDKHVPRRIWVNEITLGLSSNSSLLFGLRQIVSSPEKTIDVAPHVPGLLRQIASVTDLKAGGFSVSETPYLVRSENDAYRLIDAIESADRQLPLVVASGDERSFDPDLPLINVHSLTVATMGLAHIAAVPASFTYLLSDAFGKIRSVFHGAVRIYLPSFDATSNPVRHPLFLRETFEGAGETFDQEIRLRVARESLRRIRLHRDVVSFPAVRSLAFRLDQERRAREGASETDQLKIASRRIAALEADVERYKSEADENAQLAFDEEDRAKNAETEVRRLRRDNRNLRNIIQQRGHDLPELSVALPQSWTDFADWADEYLLEQLALAPSARRAVKDPQFEDVELAARCLLWLAAVCRDRFINGGGSLANIYIEDGIENAPCGGDTFSFDYQGRRLSAEWHIKNGGNTRDPRRCLRIYYTFDWETQLIVVADMPAHRRTGAT